MEVVISTYVNGDKSKRNDVKLLNKVVIDDIGPNDEVEIRELPSKNCSVIMNGHHMFNKERVYPEHEEKKPFLGTNDTEKCSDDTTTFMKPKRDNSNLTSGESADDSENEDGLEGLQESSRHLLKNEPMEETGAPKCLVEITKFKTMPKDIKDPHSHVHHRPLGRGLSASFETDLVSNRLNWAVVKFVCIVLVFSFIVALSCVIFGYFMTNPDDCLGKREWWQGSVTYEIFPASFLDTDGDGFGDLRGILKKLDYIKNMSVGVIRLNSIYSALDYPLEYEHVINFSNVDPHLGRMEDFVQLVSGIHGKGMKLVLDLNPTVTSDQHTWAAHWLLHRKGLYENYYINTTVVEDEPPMDPTYNNSQKDAKTPHRTFGSHLLLNWANPRVQAEFLDILDFWLRLGVDGFYIKRLEDMERIGPRTLQRIIERWRGILDLHSENTTRKILAASDYSMGNLDRRMKVEISRVIIDNFDLIDVAVNFVPNKTLEVSEKIFNTRRWSSKFPEATWISWHFGSVDTSRLGKRVGQKYVMNCLFFLTIFPGSVSIFYGDEIGMVDTYDVETKKPYKGGQLAPMQWTPAANASFTNSTKPWIPLHPDYKENNAGNSEAYIHLLSQVFKYKKMSFQLVPQRKSVLRKLISGQNQPPFLEPSYKWYHDAENSLVALEATFDHVHKFLLFANFGHDMIMLDMLRSRAQDRYWNGLNLDKVKVIYTTAAVSNGMGVGDIILDVGQVMLCVSAT